jgi:hypothetical protein
MFSDSLTIVSHRQPPTIAQHVKSRQLIGLLYMQGKVRHSSAVA